MSRRSARLCSKQSCPARPSCLGFGGEAGKSVLAGKNTSPGQCARSCRPPLLSCLLTEGWSRCTRTAQARITHPHATPRHTRCRQPTRSGPARGGGRGPKGPRRHRRLGRSARLRGGKGKGAVVAGRGWQGGREVGRGETQAGLAALARGVLGAAPPPRAAAPHSAGAPPTLRPSPCFTSLRQPPE
jgi:hypothetical protein